MFETRRNRAVSGEVSSCRYCRDKQHGRHGMSNTHQYKSWDSVVSRMTRKNCPSYKDYGGAGIPFDTRFMDFNFFMSVMGPYPSDGVRYSVDRIDATLGYVVGNVRWATVVEQARNIRKKSTNKTGFTGVQHIFTKEGLLKGFNAFYLDLTGKRHTKFFSICKYGYFMALALAVAYRTSAIEGLNAQGAGYTQFHGK